MQSQLLHQKAAIKFSFFQHIKQPNYLGGDLGGGT